MEKRNRSRISVLSLILLLIAAAALIIGLAVAKYVKEIKLPGTIKVSAELAKSIEIYEHEAVKTEHGDYETSADTVAENEYKLMPGVDIPKDPTIKVTGYTGLHAWLYVEVVGSPTDEIKFTVDTAWGSPLSITGPNGGKLYARELTSANITNENGGNLEFTILKADGKGNTVTVFEKLPRNASLELKFYGYITQYYTNDPAADFNTAFTAAATTTNG